MTHKHILPECYADTVLIELLGFSYPTHKLGIGEVKNALEKQFRTSRAVGIIDNDKAKHFDFSQYVLADEKDGIKKYIRNNHTVLVICPAFETWVYKNADSTNVDPIKFGFRTSAQFRKKSKSENVSNNQELKQFLNTIKQKQAPGFVQLKSWICEGAGIEESDL